MITASRHKFTNSDNVEMSYCVWEPERVGDCRAIVLVLHGICFHAEPYLILAQSIDIPNTLFAGLDFRGHGLSGGSSKKLPRLREMINDIGEWVMHMRSLYPDAGVYIVAESMAGPYATFYAAQNPGLLDGLVLIAPALLPSSRQVLHWRTVKDVANALRKPSSAGILVSGSRIRMREVNSVHTMTVQTRNEIAIKTVEPSYIVRLGYAMARLLAKSSVEISAPVLIIHGDNDDILSPTGSRWLFRKIKSSDKRLEFLQGASHTLVWDESRWQTFEIIKNWLSPRLALRSQT